MERCILVQVYLLYGISSFSCPTPSPHPDITAPSFQPCSRRQDKKKKQRNQLPRCPRNAAVRSSYPCPRQRNAMRDGLRAVLP